MLVLTQPHPAATLDVVATTTDNTRPDALLAPRMTRGQLEAKNLAYTSAQNGALTFVSSIADGSGTGKTVNVTATGFYYYDAPNNVWKGIGGSITPVQYRLNLGQNATAAYDWTNSAFDFWEFTTGTALSLPLPSAYNGRTISLRNNTGGTVQFSGTDGIATPKGVGSFTSQAAVQIYSNGTTWYLTAGRN